jgi:DNA mismatch repair ATPase MutL
LPSISKGTDDTDQMDAHIDADSIRAARFIAQVDRKFLICRLRTNGEVRNADTGTHTPQYIIAVDQHAAHERIRLEDILSELVRGFIDDGLKTSALPWDRSQVALSRSEADVLERIPSVEKLLCRWGMNIGFPSGRKSAEIGVDVVEIEVQTVPEVLANRFQVDPRELTRSVRGFLGYLRDHPVLEIFDQIAKGPKDAGNPYNTITEQVALRLCPPRYRDLANSNACRGECRSSCVLVSR